MQLLTDLSLQESPEVRSAPPRFVINFSSSTKFDISLCGYTDDTITGSLAYLPRKRAARYRGKVKR